MTDPIDSPPPPWWRPLAACVVAWLALGAGVTVFAVKTLRARAVHDARTVDAARDIARQAREEARRLWTARAEEVAAESDEAKRRVEQLAERLHARLDERMQAPFDAPPVPDTDADVKDGHGWMRYWPDFHGDDPASTDAVAVGEDVDPALARLRAAKAAWAASWPPEATWSVWAPDDGGLRQVEAYGESSGGRQVTSQPRAVVFHDGRRTRRWTLYVGVPDVTEVRPYTAAELAVRLSSTLGGRLLPPPGSTGRGATHWRIGLTDAHDVRAASFPLEEDAARFPEGASEGSGHWVVHRDESGAAWSTRRVERRDAPPCPWAMVLELSRVELPWTVAWATPLQADGRWAAVLFLLTVSALGSVGWLVAVGRTRRRRARAGGDGRALPSGGAGTKSSRPGAPLATAPGGQADGSLTDLVGRLGMALTAAASGREEGAFAAFVRPGATRAEDIPPTSPEYVPPGGRSLRRWREENLGRRDSPPPSPLDTTENPMLRALIRRVRPRPAGAGMSPDVVSTSTVSGADAIRTPGKAVAKAKAKTSVVARVAATGHEAIPPRPGVSPPGSGRTVGDEQEILARVAREMMIRRQGSAPKPEASAAERDRDASERKMSAAQ